MNKVFDSCTLKVLRSFEGEGDKTVLRSVTVRGLAENATAERLGSLRDAVGTLCSGTAAGAQVVTVANLED